MTVRETGGIAVAGGLSSLFSSGCLDGVGGPGSGSCGLDDAPSNTISKFAGCDCLFLVLVLILFAERRCRSSTASRCVAILHEGVPQMRHRADPVENVDVVGRSLPLSPARLESFSLVRSDNDIVVNLNTDWCPCCAIIPEPTSTLSATLLAKTILQCRHDTSFGGEVKTSLLDYALMTVYTLVLV